MLTIKLKIHQMKCDYSDRQSVLAKFRRSFSEGVGSIMSLQGGYIELPLGSEKDDARRLYSDWSTVGGELRKAYKNERTKSTL